MFQKKVFYICLLLFAVSKVSAQVNLQTGSAVFSLPIFSWDDDKSRLYSSVTLSYNSGNGLKVNDVASNVGQGWDLVTGGVITRLQVGEPDDQFGYDLNPANEKDITKYPNGIMYANIPAQNGCPDALRKYPIYEHKNQVYKNPNDVAADKQVDYFSFVLNGKAGMFILNKTDFTGIPVGDTKMKISFTEDIPGMAALGIRTTISSFTIIDVDGLIYKFSEISRSKVLEMNYCNRTLQQKQTQPKFKENEVYNEAGFDNPNFVRPWVVTGWYLKEIEDPLTHRTIKFYYDLKDISTIAGEDISYNEQGHYALITHKTSIAKTPELNHIDFQDGHRVQLYHSLTNRVDLPGQFALEAIDVTYNGRNLSRHIFNTSYFILNRYGTPVTDYQKQVARLCLLSVQKLGVDLKEDTPPYKFDYHMGQGRGTDDYVPPPFSYAKDNWGFYNGLISKGADGGAIDITTPATAANHKQLRGLCFVREGQNGFLIAVKDGYAKNGLLKQIIYPTGGTLSYEYVQNWGEIRNTTGQQMVGGVHVSQIKSTDGGYVNDCSNPLITNYNYVLENSSNSSLWGIEMPRHTLSSTTHYAPEKRIYDYFNCLPLGCCKYKYRYPGIISKTQSVNISDILKALEVVSVISGIISSAQLVIHAIQAISAVTGPGAVIIDVIASLVNIVLTCSNNPSKDNLNTILYNNDLNAVSPLPTQFKRVEVVEGAGGNGKTVHEFTSEDQYTLWEPTNELLSAKQRYAPWAYGLPLKVTVYKNGSSFPVKQTENVYNFNTHYSNFHCGGPPGNPHYNRDMLLKKEINISSCKCMVRISTSQRNTEWNNSGYYNDPNSFITDLANQYIGADIYKIYTGRTELNKVYERTFKPGTNEFLEATTEYVYNDENYEISLIKTTNSDGTKTQKNIHYTIDYKIVHADCYTVFQTGTSNAEINTLCDKNIISLPVETSTFAIRTSSPKDYYLNATTTVFETLSNGDIKPLYSKEARFNEPLAFNTILTYWIEDGEISAYNFPQPLYDHANASNSSNAFFKTTQTFTYDAAGNLIGLKDEGNRQVTNIYDYQDKYIVASIINADPLLDYSAYSSFESESLGGWSLSGGATTPLNGGITGSKYFPLNSKTLSRGLNTSKAYTLSFWASNSVSVSGSATLTTSGPAINGYTYYQYNVPQGTPTISITGNSNIDELRVYPAMARMRTVTYDPLIGKTSECDENNRITYYEYDNLGRLRFIKDDKSNIVKMYEYNNVSDSKLNGCPMTYYNRFISEKYVKNSCDPGYQGNTYIATVPAAMFSSTVSQKDADVQAEHYLLIHGQADANSTAGCTRIWYNEEEVATVTSESCGDGYVGGNVTYTVPAGRYSSLIDLADANQQALDDIEANAQAYANDPAHSACTLSTVPRWEWDNIHSYCANVGGNLPAHLFVFEIDVNPNSSTYNTTRWNDVGPRDECPSNLYYNTQQSKIFYKNDCSTGFGAAYTVTAGAGTFSSTTSVAAANTLAINYINSNGQSQANANGSCCSPSFSWTSGLTPLTANISLSGSTVSLILALNISGSPTSFSLGNINTSCCYPTATRVIPVIIGSSEYQISVQPGGAVSVQWISGPVLTGGQAFMGSYDLFANSFYSGPASGYFTKNDCPSGQVGSNEPYYVPKYKYQSTVDQATADQLATNDVAANGQGHANSVGGCSTVCSFTPAGGMSFLNASITSNGTNTSFQFVFNSPSSLYNGGTLGTISTACRPSTIQNLTVVDGSNSSRSWNVSIQTNGSVSISLASGPTGYTSPIYLAGSYPQ